MHLFQLIALACSITVLQRRLKQLDSDDLPRYILVKSVTLVRGDGPIAEFLRTSGRDQRPTHVHFPTTNIVVARARWMRLLSTHGELLPHILSFSLENDPIKHDPVPYWVAGEIDRLCALLEVGYGRCAVDARALA